MKNATLTSNRNLGIDLLRILSMLYVLILHTLGRGGILEAARPHSAQYFGGWFLEIWAYGAVDIFALISGYVCYSDQPKRVKFSGFAGIWMQAVFYGLLVTAGVGVLRPDLVSGINFLEALLPVSSGLYWYLTAYAGLFLMMPFLNAGLRQLDESAGVKIFWLLFLAFSVFDTVFKRFELNNGYAAFWLVVVYLLGGLVKKCHIGEKLKGWQAFLGIVLLTFIGWLWKAAGPRFTLFDVQVTKDLLVCYTSPTVLGASILYLISFAKLKLPHWAGRVIRFAAPGAFAAYLLNNQQFVWGFLYNRFVRLAGRPLPLMLAGVVGFSLAFFVGSVLLDAARRWLFERVLPKKFLAAGCAR